MNSTPTFYKKACTGLRFADLTNTSIENLTLFPWQIQGAAWLKGMEQTVIQENLNDTDTGIGKTIRVLFHILLSGHLQASGEKFHDIIGSVRTACSVRKNFELINVYARCAKASVFENCIVVHGLFKGSCISCHYNSEGKRREDHSTVECIRPFTEKMGMMTVNQSKNQST